jgi:hypothetical protein
MNFLIGMLSNRIRGIGTRILFLNSDKINALIFAGVFSTEWWHIFVLFGAMLCGSATGWTEFLAGCEGRYELNSNEDYNWISKIVKPKDQFTTLLYGSFRAFIWVACLEIGLLICSSFSWILLISIPLFYVCYRLAYLVSKKGSDWVCIAELLWGAVLWGLYV